MYSRGPATLYHTYSYCTSESCLICPRFCWFVYFLPCSPYSVIILFTHTQPQTAEDLLSMLEKGNRNRTQHPTNANATSSRSHAVFQVQYIHTYACNQIYHTCIHEVANIERVLCVFMCVVKFAYFDKCVCVCVCVCVTLHICHCTGVCPSKTTNCHNHYTNDMCQAITYRPGGVRARNHDNQQRSKTERGC